MARVWPKGATVELPITPMLDMTFQLLSFFVLTFHPQAATEGKLDCGLPAPGLQLERAEPAGLDESDWLITLVVKAARDGNIGALLVRLPEGEVDVGGLEGLKRELESRRRDSAPGIRVQIAAEGRLKYACVMDVFDTCLQSGCSQVGFAAPPD